MFGIFFRVSSCFFHQGLPRISISKTKRFGIRTKCTQISVRYPRQCEEFRVFRPPGGSIEWPPLPPLMLRMFLFHKTDCYRWWFQHVSTIFYVHPYFGEDSHCDEHIFQIGLVQPPTRLSSLVTEKFLQIEIRGVILNTRPARHGNTRKKNKRPVRSV